MNYFLDSVPNTKSIRFYVIYLPMKCNYGENTVYHLQKINAVVSDVSSQEYQSQLGLNSSLV